MKSSQRTDKCVRVCSATGYRKQIEGGDVTFAKLASEFSDCSSARKGGDLGVFGRGQMQKPFEDATYVRSGVGMDSSCRCSSVTAAAWRACRYALKVGEMSGIVDTNSGLHIIVRTA